MPNLLPDWLGWIRPAGRLIWSLLFTGVGLALVAALLRPPLPRKIIRPAQIVPAVVGVFVLGILAARVVSALQTVMIWLTIAGLLAVTFAAVLSRDPRPADRTTTWAEAMAGALGVFALFTLAYGVVPHEWLTYANAYLNMSSDRFVVHPFDRYVKIPFSALRDTVATLIYVAFFGLNLVLWLRWQERLVPKLAATPEEAPPRRSRFGRPLRAKA